MESLGTSKVDPEVPAVRDQLENTAAALPPNQGGSFNEPSAASKVPSESPSQPETDPDSTKNSEPDTEHSANFESKNDIADVENLASNHENKNEDETEEEEEEEDDEEEEEEEEEDEEDEDEDEPRLKYLRLVLIHPFFLS